MYISIRGKMFLAWAHFTWVFPFYTTLYFYSFTNSEVNGLLWLHYIYLIPLVLVTLQIWINNVSKVIQTSCTFTSFDNTIIIKHIILYIILKWTNLHND